MKGEDTINIPNYDYLGSLSTRALGESLGFITPVPVAVEESVDSDTDSDTATITQKSYNGEKVKINHGHKGYLEEKKK